MRAQLLQRRLQHLLGCLYGLCKIAGSQAAIREKRCAQATLPTA